MDSGEEYNAIFAATIAAATYAIAAQEEKQKTSPVQPPTKRGESMRKPTGGSKLSRWFSAKEPAEDAEGPGILINCPLHNILCYFHCSKTSYNNVASHHRFSQRIGKEAAETRTEEARRRGFRPEGAIATSTKDA